MGTSHITIRIALAVALAAAVTTGLASTAAADDDTPHIRRTCKKIDHQIAYYEGVVEMAEDQRDYMRWDAMRAHVKRLEARRPRLCPEQVAEERRRWFRRGAEAAKDAVKLASSMAIRYFTAGATGGSPF